VTDQQARFLETIKNNVQRMTVLVSDLNDISRIESGQLYVELGEVDLKTVFGEVKEGVMRQIEERSHKFVEQIDAQLPSVQGDRSRVVQVLVNLLSNAYKYTPNGGTIILSAKRNDDRVSISVSDTGVGMTPEQVKRLGTKFWRADNAHVTNQPGSGLGLAITQNLITLMGGELNVQSTPGKGSTFTVSLQMRAVS
jgi:signal transduction histidine kinase